MAIQPNPATSAEVLAAVQEYIAHYPEKPALDVATAFALNRLPAGLRRQIDADREAFMAGWLTLTLRREPLRTGTQDATGASREVRTLYDATGWYVWRVSPGGGSERMVCSVPDEAYGRRYVDWLNTHPKNRNNKIGHDGKGYTINDRFELRRDQLAVYVPKVPAFADEVRPYDQNDIFPG